MGPVAEAKKGSGSKVEGAKDGGGESDEGKGKGRTRK